MNNEHTGGRVFHEHDFGNAEDSRPCGVIQYHFDCPTPWHSAPGVDADHHAKLAALALSGVKGDDLRARIIGGQV
jgi:hypothetical protein